jgi:hypothetical protein
MIMALRWAGLNSREERPEVEDLGLAAEDGGDDRGGAGQPAYLTCRQSLCGSEVGGAEVLAQLLQGHGDDQGGGITTVGRHPSRVQGLEQRAERLPAFAVDRDPVALPRPWPRPWPHPWSGVSG